MQPPNEDSYSTPPTPDEQFLAGLKKSIDFHRTNQIDNHGIGNAVICSLLEVHNAFAASRKLPLIK